MKLEWNGSRTTWLSCGIFLTLLTLGAITACVVAPLKIWQKATPLTGEGGTQISIENGGKYFVKASLSSDQLYLYRWDHEAPQNSKSDDEGVKICLNSINPPPVTLSQVQVYIKSGYPTGPVLGEVKYITYISSTEGHCSDLLKSCQGPFFVGFGLNQTDVNATEPVRGVLSAFIKRISIGEGTCGLNRIVYVWILISVVLPLVTLVFCCCCVSILVWLAFRNSLKSGDRRYRIGSEENETLLRTGS